LNAFGQQHVEIYSKIFELLSAAHRQLETDGPRRGRRMDNNVLRNAPATAVSLFKIKKHRKKNK
jgi:hypothetical protein